MIAHLAGAPLEELLLPMLSSGGALVLALRSALTSQRRRMRRAQGERPVRTPGT
jgi:hypothetical protein